MPIGTVWETGTWEDTAWAASSWADTGEEPVEEEATVTGLYAADHANALAMLQAAGAATSFSLRSPGTEDASTGRFTGGSTSTVSGYAIKVRSTPREEQRYRELGLVLQQTVTLLFAPNTYGDTPVVASEVESGGVTYTVRSVETVAPDGVTITARVGASL